MYVDIFNPAGLQFDLIAADPPWQYGSRGARGGKFGKLPYNDMTIPEIKALPVADIAADTAILQMWFTAAFGREAYEVCEAWGFKPIRIDQVWAKRTVNDKSHGVAGPWGMTDCEFILLGTRGKAHSQLLNHGRMKTLQHVQYPGVHSGKPAHFYDVMDERFNCSCKIELFAREARDGWCRWGDQA